MAFINSNQLLLSLCFGLIPTLFWLWFWLKKDPNPEPRKTLILTFFSGMLAVFPAFIFEYFILYAEKKLNVEKTLIGVAALLLFWAFIEEILKYFAAKNAALKKPEFDEPIDALIYLITAALGFAALENIFFLFGACAVNSLPACFITGNFRFLGATLLHTAASAVVGASIAFSFFHKKNKRRNVAGGILLATILHFIFNYFIIESQGQGEKILRVFIPLWVVIIIIIFIFEKVKRIKK
jgi:RsiW-degrading membrane proteinase PrsW (M82 family)